MRIRRYLGLLWPHAPALGLASGLLAMTAAAPPVAVLLLERALARVMTGDVAALTPVAAAFVGLYAVHGLGVVGRTWVTKRVAWSVASDLRRALHARWLATGPDGTVGDRLVALTDEVDQVQYGVSAGVTALRNPLALAGLVAVAASVSVPLTAFAVGLWLPAVGIAWAGGRSVRRLTTRAREARASLATALQEQLAGVSTLRAFGAEAMEAERLVEIDDADRGARLALEVGRTVPALGVQLWAAIALAALLVLGTRGVASGTLAPASLVALVAALGFAARPLSGLAEVHSLMQRSLGALERVEGALARPDPVPAPRIAVDLPPGPLGLRWERVDLILGGRRILADVDIEAHPGQILALVGPTGAGKTSLLRLAWRFIDPTAGAVSLGGVDLRQVAPAALRAAVAVVPQDLFLFGRSVLGNVALGDPRPDRAAATRALHDARAGFALDLPGGLDAVLPEGARGLSGGERQRLALARALYREPRVLLLDEPTSQVDEATTRGILDTLRTSLGDRTVVVVAHDPLVAELADVVVEIARGRVAPGWRWTAS